jgi:hypothetical protein
MIKDQYGREALYLVQPTRLDYEIGYPDAEKLTLEGRFRTYGLADEEGTMLSNIRMQFNRISAMRMAKNNNLRLIDDYDREKLYDYHSSSPLNRYLNSPPQVRIWKNAE